MIAEGTSGEPKAAVGSGALRVRLPDPAQRPEAERLLSRHLDAAVQRERDPAVLSARVTDTDRVAPALAELSSTGVVPTEFSLGQPSPDEAFLALTGRPATADAPTDNEQHATEDAA